MAPSAGPAQGSGLALEAFKEGRPVDLGVVTICEILKKIRAALRRARATTDPSFQPRLVWEGGRSDGAGKVRETDQGV